MRRLIVLLCLLVSGCGGQTATAVKEPAPTSLTPTARPLGAQAKKIDELAGDVKAEHPTPKTAALKGETEQHVISMGEHLAAIAKQQAEIDQLHKAQHEGVDTIEAKNGIIAQLEKKLLAATSEGKIGRFFKAAYHVVLALVFIGGFCYVWLAMPHTPIRSALIKIIPVVGVCVFLGILLTVYWKIAVIGGIALGVGTAVIAVWDGGREWLKGLTFWKKSTIGIAKAVHADPDKIIATRIARAASVDTPDGLGPILDEQGVKVDI